MPAAARIAGQRKYTLGAVHQLAVLRRAQEAGFTLDEIRLLFFGFSKSTTISARWRDLAAKKQIELDAQIMRVQQMKDLLKSLETRCECDTVNQCGAGILCGGFSEGRRVNVPNSRATK